MPELNEIRELLQRMAFDLGALGPTEDALGEEWKGSAVGLCGSEILDSEQKQQSHCSDSARSVESD